MSMSDPIADMLTRIRNASFAKHDKVNVPSSKLKVSIVEILKREGYIESFDVSQEGVKETIEIKLKYSNDKKQAVIFGIKRISKPGLRVFAQHSELPKVLGGFGTAIISTNKGVITDKEARKLGVGGEVIAFVW